MAPGILAQGEETPSSSYRPGKNSGVSRSIFPDGIRTSGQHPPLYEKLRPYSDFPAEIKGATVWRKEDYEENPERWTRPLTDDEVQELGAAADRFIESGTPLTGISKVMIPDSVVRHAGKAEGNHDADAHPR